MIETARRARRPDRQPHDARFAQAMRALPACNFRRSEVVRGGRLDRRAELARKRFGSESARFVDEQH
jgi:hypothetical protein